MTSSPHPDELEYYTNGHFSRSFNSLILDDLHDELRPKKIAPSPPFRSLDPGHSDDEVNITHHTSRRRAAPQSTPQIKRSSKFLNLSIDSTLRLDDDIDAIDAREPTPMDTSSPLAKTPVVQNKFKRPHKLVSQSPSPSPSHKLASSPQSSPQFGTPDRRSVLLVPSSGPRTVAGANKLRKTSATPFKSPFSRPGSSVSRVHHSPPFECYHLEDVELDSPSKSRKSSSGGIIVYQDIDAPKKTFSGPMAPKSFDDKENRASYRFVKPLQTAFKSSGLMKKSAASLASQRKLPETPIKKNPLMLINTNKAAPAPVDDDSEISIELGRNNSTYANDSTISIFRVGSASGPSTINLDVDLDMECMVPETPTKSVKKSHSTPVAGISPVPPPDSRSHQQLSLPSTTPGHRAPRNLKSLIINCTDKPTKGDRLEPSTPTNLLHFSKQALRKKGGIGADIDGIMEMSVEDDEPVPGQGGVLIDADEHLISKFGMQNIQFIGAGEFSVAYECTLAGCKYAVKRSKRQLKGRDLNAIEREIEALRVLTAVKDSDRENLQENEAGKEYLVYFIEAWEYDHYWYIMTEFCDNGTLATFLDEHKNYKLDEFRIWKILIEILTGLQFIHSKNYLHLDLKPANIFVTFEGSLKIGDFGLATPLPILESDFDLEGDRNYIAPELINDKIYTPFADIFSVGLIILEMAANIVLPDNGTPWRKLRSGDLSDAGRLSSDNINEFLAKDGGQTSLSSAAPSEFSASSLTTNAPTSTTTAGSAPLFLVSGDSMNLDRLVQKMLRPGPFDRPTARAILEMDECVEVENSRKAAATIFEGEFGPGED